MSTNSKSTLTPGALPDGLELLCAADHPAQPVEWLWPQRIPLGKVTLLAGDPGLGKSLLALDIAARVTRAAAFPDPQPPAVPGVREPEDDKDARNGRATETQIVDIQNTSSNPRQSRGLTGKHAPGSVLILAASDDFADTIRPRLDAAGADPARIFTLPAITDLRHDFDQLEAAVDRIPDCRLIIVDPVNAFVGPGDSHYHTVVRRVLTPLMRLAARKRIAVLAVTQFRKNDGAAIHRAAGSTGFVATARSLWTVCRDPRDASRNLLLPIKQNLTQATCGFAYRIVQIPGALAAHIHWELETTVPTTEEAFARPKKPPAPSPERIAARIWLKQILADGPRPASLVLQEGEAHGFLPRTLQRAFHEFGGQTAKRGLLHGWWWSLADESNEAAPTVATPATPAGTPTKEADFFEGVTFDEDVAEQRAIDELLTKNDRELALARIADEREFARSQISPIRPPQRTPSESAANASRTGPVASNSQPPKGELPSQTGHQPLDQILAAVENSLRPAQPAVAGNSPPSRAAHKRIRRQTSRNTKSRELARV